MARHAARARGGGAVWLLVVAALLLITWVWWAGTQQTEPAPPAAEPPAPAPQQAAPYIADSRPLEMYIPAIGLDAAFESNDCRAHDGTIDPATLDLACAYTAPDRPYSLPGSQAEDIVVTAGHTGSGVEAVFDKLYDGSADHHTVREGDVLYLRTEASGEAWLKYTATDFHDPVKASLSSDASIWGAGPTPGRLLTISCIQPPFYQQSVRNAVVGWQFQGVVGPVAGAIGPAPALPPQQ
ncbi:hypothetical protein [Corynebacterium wankanglinii]|uniref:Sortase n=1 Tax=Corynebacterium wankanglinii TaxID=2735136 RepID=A0A838CLG9_9CORY|nr:hypothetical protein [Corynebacterium wankanglinii]MBA1835633.1 hypothetical protein [Corynebacterium wankanglinii]